MGSLRRAHQFIHEILPDEGGAVLLHDGEVEALVLEEGLHGQNVAGNV